MTTVDDLLSSYSLTRETATAYVDAIVRMNQTECAEEIGVTRPTVNRFKKAFAAMSAEERAFLIGALFDERWRELVHRCGADT